MLPRRMWNAWDGPLPVARMAGVSALLTFLSSFAVGIPGLLRYAGLAAGDVADNIILTSHAVNTGRAPLMALPGAFAVSLFSLPAFLFFTPVGWLSTYLFVTGLYRSIASATGEPQGDPLLDLLEARWTAARRRRRERMAAAERRALEGPEVPDVLLSGPDGGVPEAEYVVIASRLKPGWEQGTFVMTPDAWYRLGPPFDRHYVHGLRRVYPLIRPGEAEVIRRQVRYQLPPFSEE